jgi:DNA-binding CsgD family transcriptional regulator
MMQGRMRAAIGGTPESLQVHTAVLDRDGKIVEVNEGWKAFARQNNLGLPNYGISANYLSFCNGTKAEFRDDLVSLVQGELDLLTQLYPCHSPIAQRWFLLIGTQRAGCPRGGAALMHIDLEPFLPQSRERPLIFSNADRSLAGIGDMMLQSIDRAIREAVSSAIAGNLAGQNAPSLAPNGQAAVLKQPPAYKELSRRQREVFELLGRGLSNAEIARALGISPHTVRLHVSAILQRLEIENRTQAALVSVQLGRSSA